MTNLSTFHTLNTAPFSQLFLFTNLNLILIFLVGYIGMITFLYSRRYLDGDRNRSLYFKRLLLLILSSVLMLISNHIGLFFLLSCISNVTLTKLMMHKTEWAAARASARLALRNFTFSNGTLAAALLTTYYVTGSTSISNIQTIPHANIISLLLILSAISQSALWPFHRWLLSSLNSPTPVSALMHAGFINGGGILICKFSNIFSQSHSSMMLLFILGTISAILGSIWKLMQTDVKRMLACSTVAQMGFMLAQCGLGLFSAAVAHLFFHGMFKAYLFLSSASAAQEKKHISSETSILNLVKSLTCGILGAWMYAYTTNKEIFVMKSTILLPVIVLISSTQLSLSVMEQTAKLSWIKGAITAVIFSCSYGALVSGFQYGLSDVHLWQPQDLNLLHILGIIMYALMWLGMLLTRYENLSPQLKTLFSIAYVKLLNSSQPYPETITSFRKKYSF